MPKADRVHSTPPPNSSLQNLASPPVAWQHAIIRLAGATDRVAKHISIVLAQPLGSAEYVRGLRDLVRDAIDTLDQIDGDADLEDSGNNDLSLGSHGDEGAAA
ncbi:hypothetical protein [Bradyrhizobium sp. LA6.12]|uniref:hypothetical protein n=1 Tax=unclassified Bradyrhizobium TaxID=2631580 RepID=UPI003391A89A